MSTTATIDAAELERYRAIESAATRILGSINEYIQNTTGPVWVFDGVADLSDALNEQGEEE